MAHVVTDSCQDCRFTDCVTACPVDCFWADGRMLYIDPVACIGCGACEPECPVDAIHPDTDLPSGQEQWAQINAERVASGELRNITEQETPLAQR